MFISEQVCDLMVVPVPSALVNPDTKPKLSLSTLKRSLYEFEDTDEIKIEIPSNLPVSTGVCSQNVQIEWVICMWGNKRG